MEVPINIMSELKETFDSVNKALRDACELALKQPIPGMQLVLITDSSFRSAGNALMIEDNPDQKYSQSGKRMPPRHLAQNFSALHNLKCPYTQKNFWQCIWHLCTHFVGSNKANNCLDRQQVSHPLFPNKGNPTSTLECM